VAFVFILTFFRLIFIDGIRKRSWLEMLNPLAQRKSSGTNDLTVGEISDVETPISSPDTASHRGKNIFVFLHCELNTYTTDAFSIFKKYLLSCERAGLKGLLGIIKK
jgi:hypothetical protein